MCLLCLEIVWLPLCHKTSESSEIYLYRSDNNNNNNNNNNSNNNNNIIIIIIIIQQTNCVQRKSNGTEIERTQKAENLMNGVLCHCRVIRTLSLAQEFTQMCQRT